MKDIVNKTAVNSRKYQAQGFIEALIAILVAGVACVVLMMVASKTIAQVNRNELEDELTSRAIQGSEMMKFLVDSYVTGENLGGIESFLPLEFSNNNLLDAGKCVAISGDINSASLTDKDQPVCNYTVGSSGGIIPSDCFDNLPTIVNPDDKADIFRVMCIHPESTQRLLVVKIFTGFTKCQDEDIRTSVQSSATTDCKVYEYTSAYSTVQSVED